MPRPGGAGSDSGSTPLPHSLVPSAEMSNAINRTAAAADLKWRVAPCAGLRRRRIPGRGPSTPSQTP